MLKRILRKSSVFLLVISCSVENSCLSSDEYTFKPLSKTVDVPANEELHVVWKIESLVGDRAFYSDFCEGKYINFFFDDGFRHGLGRITKDRCQEFRSDVVITDNIVIDAPIFYDKGRNLVRIGGQEISLTSSEGSIEAFLYQSPYCLESSLRSEKVYVKVLDLAVLP